MCPEPVFRYRHPYTLAPAQIPILDNNRVAHGRSEFVARCDGTDLFIIRSFVARDLMRSLHAREGDSRVIAARFSQHRCVAGLGTFLAWIYWVLRSARNWEARGRSEGAAAVAHMYGEVALGPCGASDPCATHLRARTVVRKGVWPDCSQVRHVLTNMRLLWFSVC
jgi:hypothetical protein